MRGSTVRDNAHARLLVAQPSLAYQLRCQMIVRCPSSVLFHDQNKSASLEIRDWRRKLTKNPSVQTSGRPSVTLRMPSPALAVRILIIQDIQNVSVMHPFLVPRSPLVCCRTLIGLHASCVLPSPALPSHESRSLSLPSPSVRPSC